MDQLKQLAELIGKSLVNAGKATVGTAGAAGAGIGYALSGDNKEYKKNQAKKYTEAANMAREALKEFGFDDTKKTDVSKGQIGSFNPGKYAKNTMGAAADLAGYVTGTGGGAKTIGGKIMQRLGANTLLGSAQAVDDSDSAGDFVTKALTNSALSSGGELAGKGVQFLAKVPGKIVNSITSDIGKKAQMAVAKATPEKFMKAVQEHGIDINELVKKYYPPGSSYEDVIGDITERGNGGFLSQTMKQAEDKIQKQVEMAGSTMRLPVDDIVSELTGEIKLLKKVPGNEANITALEKFVKDTKKIYKNGVTAKQALAVKRAADSKFGKSIADEDTGSVINQGQKMLANYFRSKLKQTFPEIADALDTQSEIFTLKPLLEKARGISNTKGSEIRAGKLANVQLFNPLSWGNAVDVALDSPQVASKWMDAGKYKLPVPELNMAPKAGQLAGMGTSGLFTVNPDEQINTNPEQSGNDPNAAENPNNGSNQNSLQTGNSPNNIPQDKPIATPNPDELVTITNDATGETKQVKRSQLGEFGIQPEGTKPQSGLPFTSEQLMQGIIKAQMAGDVGAQKELGKMLEVVSAYEEMQAKSEEKKAKAVGKPNQYVMSAQKGIDKMKNLYGLVDDKGNEVKGPGLSAGDSTTGNLGINALVSQGNVAMKKQDQKFLDKLKTYENFRASVIPMLNQAIGAGTPQAGELENLIKSMPNENSSTAEAKAWFENVQFLLEQSRNNPVPQDLNSPVNFNQLQTGY